jgi:8-oxo-dGTP pyrophosphatase MutT (NUDIX family)
MSPEDQDQYHLCALRELREEARIPKQWKDDIGRELSSFPTGRRLVELTNPRTRARHQLAVWIVFVPDSYLTVLLNPDGEREAVRGTLAWRNALEVFGNQRLFRTFAPLADILTELLFELTDTTA